MNDLSERLSNAIKASGLSQRELEVKTGIPHSAIQRYASGTTNRIPIGRIEVLAKALGTTAEYLLGWDISDSYDKSDDRLSEFIELFVKLTESQQDMIIASMKGILNNR